MDLSTKYLGMQLRTPLVASASPLSQEISGIRNLEDAGASAVVLYSLFEEQLHKEALELELHLNAGTESFAESHHVLSTFQRIPHRAGRISGAHSQSQVRSRHSDHRQPQRRDAGRLGKFARQVEQAGADAIECNLYFIPTNTEILGSEVETTYADILREVKDICCKFR